ncbi:type II toxin-antitoxin system HicB family antitoxin [Mesorhizobium sp. DCY119]|uniref:type II toxin-antitoxin system HicB family antitoxin n=1 Tax=Mesorhizobium sp. DCY119 TaxID=2108445 RepID=UPI000E6D149A|nr:type II toxin-antitoxin system HicB family antitoxin [Mesorhizobium sp. DCY119]RJG46521.1 ribbon-helix-helix protein, CopG family [Mesorhizobium sp. DCY119]
MPLAYALIHEEGGSFGISFPDFPGCISGGSTAEEAIRRGSEALSFHAAGMVEDGDALPMLRSLSELQSDAAFSEMARDGVLAMVPFEIPGKSVRINISMDEHLIEMIDRAAAASGKSRSGFLAHAARSTLTLGDVSNEVIKSGGSSRTTIVRDATSGKFETISPRSKRVAEKKKA